MRLATLLEGAGCVRNISNISKNSKIYYGVNKAVKLDNYDEYFILLYWRSNASARHKHKKVIVIVIVIVKH